MQRSVQKSVQKSVIETLWFRVTCGLFITACVAVRTVEGLDISWNGIRFARAYALARGFDLYSPPDSGVISGLIYGPVGYFLFAPAALWTSPLPALATACLISALATLGPAALVLSDRANSSGAKPWVLPVFTVLVLHFYAASATIGVWTIHTDAAAMGLMCMTLYWTLRHAVEKTFSWHLAAAAICAALAVWSKQTAAPILVVPAAYLFLAGCRRGAWRLLGLTGVAAALMGIVFGVWYGFSDLQLTIFEIPSGHARFAGAPLLEWRLITEFMEILFLLGVVLAASAALEKNPGPAELTNPGEGRSLLSRCRRLLPEGRAWMLFCGMGLALLPMAFLGRMKVSGRSNNFGAPDYFLALGIALLFLCLAGRGEFRQGAGRRALQASLLLLLAILGARNMANFIVTGDALAARWPPPIQAAYEHARAHPGTTYFPWYPLANLMADGSYNHTAWGVLERDWAGFPVSEAHLRAELPENLQRIATFDELPLIQAIHSRTWDHFVLRSLPEFRCLVTAPDLPGWTVLERGPETCESANAVRDTRPPSELVP